MIPAFYGLPKVHKPEAIPVRPIVSSIGSVTYNITRHSAWILEPLVGRTEHHVKNIKDFVDKIKDIEVQQNEAITSYDVCALFTCIPPKDAVEVVKEYLIKDTTLSDHTELTGDDICELLDLCLSSTYFIFNGTYYKQQYGCAMGSPVSPIVVNLYMELFEKRALKTCEQKKWYRYVDYTFVVLDENKKQEFFDHINNVDSNIKLTEEFCKDNKLAFVDCLVEREVNGSFSTSVYHKPTHTDQYLLFDSCHPLEHKLGVIRTLEYRADSL